MSKDPKAPPISIEDLGKPQLAPDLHEYMQSAVRETPIDWSVEGVLSVARKQTGLDEFNADSSYYERLSVILESMDEDKDLSDFGRLTNFNILTRIAVNRLRIEDIVAKHPEILEEQIRAPIIIAGLPRSGTTHMLNLISADERLRHLPYWESLEPVPHADEKGAPRAKDPRRTRCTEELVMQNAIMPYFKNMHEMTADHTHEEIQLACMDFSCMLFENYAVVPRWRDYFLAHDQSPHYAYIKKVLQVLQWHVPKERWVLKSPQHMEQLPVLHKIFPDACYVLPHRDPLAIVVSLATMMSYTGRMSRTTIRPKVFADYWCDRLRRMLRSMVEHIPKLPTDKTIHVLFDDFMADDLATIGRIYETAKHPMDKATHSAMNHYIKTHPRGRLGRIEYDLDTLGIDVSFMREQFRFYTDEYGIRAEY